MIYALSTLLDAAGVVLFAVSPRRVRVALLAGWLVKHALLTRVAVDPFWGGLHLLWLDAIVVVPLAGLLLVLRARPAPLRVAGALAVLLAPAGAYASLVEPTRLAVSRSTVPIAGERAGDRPLRVAVLADLQFERVGAHEREAVERAMALRPDLVLLPGDIHQGSAATLRDELPAIRALLRRLRAPGGVWFVGGDQERGDEARRVVAGTGVRLLEDELVRTRAAGRRITIAGLRLSWTDPPGQRALRALEEAPEAGDVRIVLAHRPDAVLDLRPRTRVDLVVAGHTHGGQLQLPLLGPPFIASGVPREVGAGGLHDVGAGRRIFVSRGIGVERGDAPKLRFLARPEVALLTLEG